jgi:hypothetical protein
MLVESTRDRLGGMSSQPVTDHGLLWPALT